MDKDMTNQQRTTLSFVIEELRPIIEHAKAAKKFRAPYGCKPKPSLYFVKDGGIYLMSAGQPAQTDPSGRTKLLVVYAKGYEPDVENSWDKCSDAVGSSDFCEALPLEWFTQALDKGATMLQLYVNEKNITCSTK